MSENTCIKSHEHTACAVLELISSSCNSAVILKTCTLTCFHLWGETARRGPRERAQGAQHHDSPAVPSWRGGPRSGTAAAWPERCTGSAWCSVPTASERTSGPASPSRQTEYWQGSAGPGTDSASPDDSRKQSPPPHTDHHQRYTAGDPHKRVQTKKCKQNVQ